MKKNQLATCFSGRILQLAKAELYHIHHIIINLTELTAENINNLKSCNAKIAIKLHIADLTKSETIKKLTAYQHQLDLCYLTLDKEVAELRKFNRLLEELDIEILLDININDLDRLTSYIAKEQVKINGIMAHYHPDELLKLTPKILHKLADLSSLASKHNWLSAFNAKMQLPDLPRIAPFELDFLVIDIDAPKLADLTEVTKILKPTSIEFNETTELNKLFVRNFKLPINIGIYEHEYNCQQSLHFDIEVTHLSPRIREYNLTSIISYDLILDAIYLAIQAEHIEYVEEIADKIIDWLFKHPKILTVKVAIAKTDVINGLLGIEISRDRADYKL